MPSAAPVLAAPRAELEIRKARLRRAVSGDRERMSQQLGSFHPRDIGLGSRSILFVPRLVVGRPLSRQCGSSAFTCSVADMLRAALQRARRPWDSHSAEDPLLFEDEADAIATMIADWLDGRRDTPWLTALTQGTSLQSWCRRHVLTNPLLLARVIARLVERRIASRWVDRLDRLDVETAIASLEDAYSLPAAPLASGAGARERRYPAGRIKIVLTPLVTEALDADLPPRARLLIALALLARRRPELLSTAAIKAELDAISREELPPTLEGRERPRPKIVSEPEEATESLASTCQTEAKPAVPERSAKPLIESATVVVTKAKVVRDQPPTASSIASSNDVRTNFGGLFFLINALISLGVYGDFTRPRHVAPGLSPFELLAMIGEWRFGSRFKEDDLHGLLLELCGKDEAQIGSTFEAPRWSVPNDWLQPWPDQRSFTLVGGRNGFWLWHRAGFPVAELRSNDQQMVRRIARRYGCQRVSDGRQGRQLPRSRAKRWVHCLCLYLQARLAVTLTQADAVDLMCRQPATVTFDPDRVTVRYSLADHPLSIRVAGLDRDPGWLPAAGRIMEFAFE